MDLDKLQEETEKLLALLKDRQSGLYTWHESMAERMVAIKRLIKEAGY